MEKKSRGEGRRGGKVPADAEKMKKSAFFANKIVQTYCNSVIYVLYYIAEYRRVRVGRGPLSIS